MHIKHSYKIVAYHEHGALEETVEEYLNTGWKLAGNPFYADGRYFQAMTAETVEAE